MTPFKPMRELQSGSSFDLDTSMDADESRYSESTMLDSPPKALSRSPRQGVSSFTASRLFDDEDDLSEKQAVLKPVDLNLALTETAPESLFSKKSDHHQRKRQAEQRLNGRDLSCDRMESPIEMYLSPGNPRSDVYKSPGSHPPAATTAYKSPSSFRTMDGRTVQSKNPFSPMIMTEATQAEAAPPIDESLSFPLTFQDGGNKNENDVGGPLLRHRLHKRDTLIDAATFRNVSYHHNSFTRDGYPEKKGKLSFTGSPIKEIDELDNLGAYSHKVRRRSKGDDVVAASKETNQHSFGRKLQIDTNANCDKQYDEISPTDVMSFPMMTPASPSTPVPTTPSKVRPNRRLQTRYTPVRKPAVPQTPMPERRSRTRSFDGGDDSDLSHSSKQPKMPQSRFHSDFDIIGELGNGSFGNVFKVLSRLDGCMYAIKVAHRPAKGNADKDRMLKEVYALAALSDQADTATFHIVRYHQAWMEENRLYIQTELCTTTMAAEMKQGVLSIDRRYKFLREVCLALEFIHKNGMVHLDIKPENIFTKNDQFKLGDFGLVSKISNHQDVEEGDSRYMSIELLSGDHADLTKSDIFSLGITLYEVCLGGKSLPTNGPEWQALRSAEIRTLPNTPVEMQRFVKLMMNPVHAARPSASELLKRPQLLSEEEKELLAEKNKVVQANLALLSQQNRIRQLTPPMPKKAGLVRRSTWAG